MILGTDTTPDHQVYHVGALLLGVLQHSDGPLVDPYAAFEDLNRETRISVNAFLLALDWLYLLGCVANESGRLLRCF